VDCCSGTVHNRSIEGRGGGIVFFSPTPPKRHATRLVLAACACALVTGALDASALASPPEPPDKEAAKEAVAAATVKPLAPGSLMVHVDPKTLKLSLEPTAKTVPLEFSAGILNALNTTFDGLTPVKKGDATRWDLQGRYQGVWFVVTDAEGKARPFCVTSLPPDVAAAAEALRQKKGGPQ
jgi:hypothetical protein